MAANGRINMSKVEPGMRILVEPGSIYKDDTLIPARTKTGPGVVVTTVIRKDKATNWRGYRVVTGAGVMSGEPIQTMWLAPEDSAGIRRAHKEALDSAN